MQATLIHNKTLSCRPGEQCYRHICPVQAKAHCSAPTKSSTHATRTPCILILYGKDQGTHLQRLRQGDQCNGGGDAGAAVLEARYPFVAAHIAMPPCYWALPGTMPTLHWEIAPQPAALYSQEFETQDMCSLQCYMYWRWLSGLMLGMYYLCIYLYVLDVLPETSH